MERNFKCNCFLQLDQPFTLVYKVLQDSLCLVEDMIFNIQHIANWEHIKQRKQRLINLNNKRENSKRQQHVYQVGDKVLLNRGTENKYESPYLGPFEIMKVNDNGTVRLKVNAVEDTYNIRRVYPTTRLPTLIMGENAICGLLRRKGSIINEV